MAPNQWIKTKDFLKTTFQISVKNMTARTTVPESAKIDLIEVSDAGLVLKLPKTAGALGHLLMIHILRKKNHAAKSEHTKFDFTGKITGIEALEPASSAVTLQFYQFDEGQWRAFLNECAERQQSVNAIVKKVQE